MDFASQMLDIIFHLFNLKNVIYIILIIIGGLIFMKIGDRILNKIEHEFNLNLTAHYLFKDIIKYTIIIIAFAWILHVLGINLESINRLIDDYKKSRADEYRKNKKIRIKYK